MTLSGCSHIFGAVVDNLDRFAGFQSQQARMPRDQRRIFFLAAKAASSFSLDHTDLFFSKTEEFYQGFVNVVRTLH
jgi:hypothetical protein